MRAADTQNRISFQYESIGTSWRVVLWESNNFPVSESVRKKLYAGVLRISKEFDALYSRFIPSSRILTDLHTSGIKKVPPEFVEMMNLYKILYLGTDKKVNPLIGRALEEAGYDMNYSFEVKFITQVPDFVSAVEIVDAQHVKLNGEFVIDLGALGKGFLIDLITRYLADAGAESFMVDGSGDIRVHGRDVRIGLEHPLDQTRVIGTVTLNSGSICSSGINRRAWKGMHHIIDPIKRSSPTGILATWVTSESAAVADGLATSLFFISPESLRDNMREHFSFEYAVLAADMKITRSEGFTVELY